VELLAIVGAIVLLLVIAVLTVRFIVALAGVAAYGAVLLLATLTKCQRRASR
jgi:hypothetical protein